MAGDSRPPFQRRHKLALQSLASGIMMLAPIGLYLAAQADFNTAVLALLVALGCGMLLAAWIG